MSLLYTENVSMRFGGLTAVGDLSMRVEAGEITSIIGPNGAGKTTVFNVISGFYQASEGDVFFEDRRINGLKPHEIAAIGHDLTVGFGRVSGPGAYGRDGLTMSNRQDPRASRGVFPLALALSLAASAPAWACRCMRCTRDSPTTRGRGCGPRRHKGRRGSSSARVRQCSCRCPMRA